MFLNPIQEEAEMKYPTRRIGTVRKVKGENVKCCYSQSVNHFQTIIKHQVDMFT